MRRIFEFIKECKKLCMRNDGRDVDLYYLFSKKTWWTFIRR